MVFIILRMLLNFIQDGNFNDDLGSIVYTTEIARSQDCALVLCKLEIALIMVIALTFPFRCVQQCLNSGMSYSIPFCAVYGSVAKYI